MTQEDKELLLKDLCARLPYKVQIERTYVDYPTCLHEDDIVSWKLDEISIKPYLRPISSMTGKEETEWHELTLGQRWITFDNVERCVDWLNSHHVDYRGLIEKGLALEAPKGMYK